MFKARVPGVRLLVVLALALTPTIAWPQQSKKVTGPLWTWFGHCGEKRSLGLEISLHGKLIHKSVFPICPIRYRSEEVGASQKTVNFHFKGGHMFQDEFRTSRTETIEGSIWQAGSDPGIIYLGLFFSNGHQILLNTLHIAKPYKESTFEIDRGLSVHTFPLRRN